MAIVIRDLNEVNKEFEDFLQGLDKNFNKKNIRKAFEFAKKAHIYQQRKSGEPYISHPFEVAKLAANIGLDDNSIISAFLHDVVEDTKVSLDEIKKEFGEEVTLIVDGLTKIEVLGKKKVIDGNKNVNSLRKILLASAKDIRILVLKICDRLHNMRTLKYMKAEKKRSIAYETMMIYVPISQKIGLYSLKWELEDLAFKYLNSEMFAFIKSKVKLKRHQREKFLERSVDELKEFFKKNNINNLFILGRPKNFYSIYKKIKNSAKSFEDLHDLYAIRIITNTTSECYTILGLIHENFQSFPNRLKDYIANPKANGYESIHTVIYSKAIKKPVEIQIRTTEMHKLAEFGVAAHWRYKKSGEDKKFEKRISWLREVLQWEKEHKDDTEFLKLLKFDFFEDEIFVFTPKNDLITLPENSTVLDFAYAVHTDIGTHAFKGKINGCVSTLDKVLKSGDIVDITTSTNSKPSDRWLKFVRTSKARNKIRDFLNIKHSGKRDQKYEKISFEMLKEKIIGLEKYKKIRKAGGCDFVYGDQIVGVLSKKTGELVIHKASCENAKFTINPKVSLNWVKEKKKEVTLVLTLKDRYGLLIDILNLFSEFNLNIFKLNTKVNKDSSVKMEIKVLDGPHLKKIVNRLNDFDYVDNVSINRGFFG